MTKTVKFKPQHLARLDEFVCGISVKENISKEKVAALASQDHVYSIIKDGKVLACVGATTFWPNRCEVWAVLSNTLGADFVEVNSEVKKLLKGLPFKRIEAVVDCDFEDGIRWVKALGFGLEAACMKSYGRTGKDCAMFSMVKL